MHNDKKFLVVIPARYASTRLPGKLLIKINNKSVLQRVWEKCITTVGRQNVIVAAGDNKIHNFCEKKKINSLLISKKCLTGTDRVFEVSKKIKQAGISSNVDLKKHNLNYKIRDHSLAKIPLLLICGKKEVDSNSVTIRRLDSNKQENMDLNLFLKTFSALNKASSN